MVHATGQQTWARSTPGFGFLAMWIGLGLILGGGAVVRWDGVIAADHDGDRHEHGRHTFGSSSMSSAAARST